MKDIGSHIKILSALSMAASDTRSDTLSSVVIRTLFVKEKISSNKIISAIQEEFGFEPYEPEIFPLLKVLKEEKKIEIVDNELCLTDSEKERINNLEVSLDDKDRERFQNFKNFIIDTLEETIEVGKIKILWFIFLEYLYDSFYEYGHDAIKTLHPYIDSGTSNGTYEDVLQKAITKARENEEQLVPIFKKIVNRFPDFASEKDIEFLNDLAQKTLSFSSLGLKPELAEDAVNYSIVDWVLYLDTNVLYSLLNLHSHPEDEACHALVNLIQSNNEYIKIKLRYSEQTYRELGSKRADFALLDDKMTDSSIRALLKSDNLDDFSRKFYQNLLSNRDSTIHPEKVIELSQRTLKQEKIEIGRTGKRLESLGEEYINSRITDYFSFIDAKNNIKREFCDSKNIPFHSTFRSEQQAAHDISLREILIDSRKIKEGEELTLNNVRFFAVTLDDLLISYDKSQVRDYHDEKSFPVFFKPSFLLNKLIRVLPIKTTNYKKAFIKAITTKGFYRNTKRSEDILKIVNYLKSKGIDDERVIYNLISEEIFLEKFRRHSEDEGFDTGDFVESELNREFKVKQDQLEKTKKELDATKGRTDEAERKNELLDSKKNELETEINSYKNALNKFSKRVRNLEKDYERVSQTTLNFEAAEERSKASHAMDIAEKEKVKSENIKNSLKYSIRSQIDSTRDADLSKWQRSVWWNLCWVVPLLIFGYLLVTSNEIVNFGPLKDENTVQMGLGVIAFLCNLFFFKLVYDRYLNETAKKTRRENAKIPEHLKRQLEELD